MFTRRIINVLTRNYITQTNTPLNEQIEVKIKVIEKIVANHQTKNDYTTNEYVSKTELKNDTTVIINNLNEIKRLIKNLHIYKS